MRGKSIIIIIVAFLLIGGLLIFKVSIGGKEADDITETINAEINVKQNYSDEDMEIIGKFSSITASSILQAERNICYSPISLYSVLAVAAENSNGDTRSEILEALGVESIVELEKKYKNYDNIIKDMKSEVILGNSIWLLSDNKLVEEANETIEKCKKVFNCSFYYTNYSAKDINKWVSEQTNGKIKKFVSSDEIPEYNILSTMYFKEKWSTPFELAGKSDFYLSNNKKINVEYMDWFNSTARYIRGETYVAVNVDLYGTDMIFVSPNDDVQLKEIIKSETINEIIATSTNKVGKSDYAQVLLRVPLFNYETNIGENQINKALKDIGMEEVLKNPDWSNISNDINGKKYEIMQKTSIEVNEKGIEAAAASSISVTLSGTQQEINLVLDRPFAYILIKDGVPLFIGTVYNPAE